MKLKTDIAIVGAGIVGLAHAYVAAREGYKVTVFDRDYQQQGASVRNFGLVWPIGQAPGQNFRRAMRSREIWKYLAREAGFWLQENGSLHLAHAPDEWEVLQEFAETAIGHGYRCKLMSAAKVPCKSHYVHSFSLRGGLYSDTEMTLDPVEALSKITKWLAEKYQVAFHFGTAVSQVQMPYLVAGDCTWQADRIIICSGSDFETLLPHYFEVAKMTRCKLQMMAATSQETASGFGPTLCGGLTLRHYASFKHCLSLDQLKERIALEMPLCEEWGIHVLVTQHANGELIIGDSHTYGLTHDPFVREEINQEILRQLYRFCNPGNLNITRRWYGVYAKMKHKSHYTIEPEKNLFIVTGLGGAGMTLGFGLAEELCGEFQVH